MATLPGPDAVGPLPDNLPRRMGVGGWQPDVISQATSQAGQGLERLGTGIADYSAEQQQQTDQLQVAQAHAKVATATTGILSKLPTMTDPDQITEQSQGVVDAVTDAAGGITNPRARALFTANIAPHVAETNFHIGARGREVSNQNDLATFDQTTNGVISNAAQIDDDATSRHSLDVINAQAQALAAKGVITPVQKFDMMRNAAVQYSTARVDYLIQQAEVTHDSTRLKAFLAGQGLTPSDSGGGPVNTDVPAEGRALLQTIMGPESGGSYNRRYSPAGGADFSGFGDHPRIRETIPDGQPNAGRTSDAAGAYQFLSSTWDQEKAKLGLKDFSPASQDAAAWDLAQTTYRQQTGGDLLAALRSRDPNTLAGVASALKGQWSSLPGGVQPGTTTGKFTNNFLGALNGQNGSSFRGLPAPGASAVAAAPTPDASNSYFVGDSIADGLKGAAGAQGNTLQGRSTDDVTKAIMGIDPATIKGKTIYLSSGASNSPSDLSKVSTQIELLRQLGADPKNIRLIGVGDRADFTAAKVNDQLADIAKKAGVTFTGPMDATNLRRNPNDNSDNGVHFADWKKGLAQVAGTNAMNAGAPATAGATPATGFVDPPRSQWPAQAVTLSHAADGTPIYVGRDGAALPDNLQPAPTVAAGASASGNPSAGLSLVPPKAQWPAGTDHVAPNGDGTLSFVAADGSKTPVPGTVPTGSPAAPVSMKPTGSVLDVLPAAARAQRTLQVQNVIDRIDRSNDMATAQAEKQTSEQIKASTTQVVQGQPVPDKIWDGIRAQVMASSNPDIRADFARADAIRTNLQTYRGLSPAAVAADVANKQADYTQSMNNDPYNPTTYMKAAVLQGARDYLKTYQAEIAKDPLGRAAKDGILPAGITPINPADPNASAAIQSRVADAQRVADFYHLSEPRYLLPQEKTALKQISAVGGQPMVDLASKVVAGAGNQAGSIFKEIGGDAPAFATVGALNLLPGGDRTGVIDDIAKYTAASNDKDAKKDLPRFNDGVMKKLGVDDPVGDATQGLGFDATARARAAGNILLGARAMREGRDPGTDSTQFDQTWWDKAYNQALGATYDKDNNQFGGVAKIGGHWASGGPAQKVMVPYNMKAADFETAVGSISDADLKGTPTQPFTAGGKPIAASVIKQGHLVALPDTADGLFHGRYGVTMGDPNSADAQPVVDKNGRPWVLDMNAMEDTMRQRFPGSFLDKAPPKPAVAPAGRAAPYRSVPGMVSASAEEPSIPASE